MSVIVSVYNAEKIMMPCVESLLKQGLSKIELIFADDCSQDASGAMLACLRTV